MFPPAKIVLDQALRESDAGRRPLETEDTRVHLNQVGRAFLCKQIRDRCAFPLARNTPAAGHGERQAAGSLPINLDIAFDHEPVGIDEHSAAERGDREHTQLVHHAFESLVPWQNGVIVEDKPVFRQ